MGRTIDVDELKKKFEPKQAYFTEGIFRKIDEAPTAKPEQDRWIPVAERMPEINCMVLLSSNCGKILLGSRQKPTFIYQIDDDGSKCWIYDEELENYVDDIEVLQKAEEQGFDVDEEGFMICVSSVNYVPEAWSEGITAWKPLPEPYRPDAK